MMHQPNKVDKQTAEGVIADLVTQRDRLNSAIEWTKAVVDGIRGIGRQVTFTTVGPIMADTREVGIALSLPTGALNQDVFTFTLVCMPTEAQIPSRRLETALAVEERRLSNLLAWNREGVKVFETWFVNDSPLWRGSNEETQAFLIKEVKGWLTYWFGKDAPLPVYLPRRNLEVNALGVRPTK